jgi:hypothetical protein
VGEPQHTIRLALLGLREELQRLWELLLRVEVELFRTREGKEDVRQCVDAGGRKVRRRDERGLALGLEDGLMALCVERAVSVTEDMSTGRSCDRIGGLT